jgi:hypothetical protein
MANNKSDTKSILQATLDETNQSIKVSVVAGGGTGGATEATALDILADTTSIDAKTPALGQAVAAASVPVVLTAAQVSTLTPQTNALTDTQLRASAVPVSVSGLPLPTGAATEATLSALNTKVIAVDTGAVVVSSSVLPSGAATSANQTTANSSLSSIDTKTPALGQALAAASTPVVLTAAQISTLTPQTNALTDTQLRASAVPVSLTSTPLASGAATSANQATEIASLASIDTKLVQTSLNFGVATGAIRVASIPGNASGIASFGAGATSAQTQRVVANLAVNGADLAAFTNPAPVDIYGAAGYATTAGAAQKTFSTTSGTFLLGGINLVMGWDGATHREIAVTTTGLLKTAAPGAYTPVNGLVYAASALSTSFTAALTLQSGTTLASDVSSITVFSSTGTTLRLTWGGASPVVGNTILIPPGGVDNLSVFIPTGSDIRLASASGISTGDVVINFLG